MKRIIFLFVLVLLFVTRELDASGISPRLAAIPAPQMICQGNSEALCQVSLPVSGHFAQMSEFLPLGYSEEPAS